MLFIDVLFTTCLLLAVSGVTLSLILIFLSAMVSRSQVVMAQLPYWQAFNRPVTFVLVIGKPTRGFWCIFVWYLERFL